MAREYAHATRKLVRAGLPPDARETQEPSLFGAVALRFWFDMFFETSCRLSRFVGKGAVVGKLQHDFVGKLLHEVVNKLLN